ncbi:MAG: hypothetical protein ACRDN0_39850 [Trebonia sp.]
MAEGTDSPGYDPNSEPVGSAGLGEWPDWEISDDTLPELAKYVNPEATGVPIGAHLRAYSEDEGYATAPAITARAKELYELLFQRDIQYSRDPWNPARFLSASLSWKQRVRTPAEILQGVGSCLDLSLLFAGMAMAAGIRPLIALTRTAPTPHALVVLDLARPLGVDPVAWEEGPEHWGARGNGLWWPEPAGEAADPGVPWWELSAGHWLVVDIARVSRGANPPQAFEQACLSELPWTAKNPEVIWTLLDVEAALDGEDRYVPPATRARYPIHSYLPELPNFRDYPTRLGLVGELGKVVSGGTPGRLVLQGPGGRGKSLLAQRLAWRADNGCGGFLNATDAAPLEASLAAAEQAERGQEPASSPNADQLDGTEKRQLAFAALARLRDAAVPWVVVLDNCDKSPSDASVQRLIPQPRQAGQVVILTTRDESWAEAGAEWSYRPLAPLGPDDLRVLGLPAELAERVTDPLVAEPLAVLIKPGVTLSASEQDDPVAVTWLLVRDAAGPGSDAVRLAERLAWLPPEPVDVDGAPVAADLDLRREAANQLVRYRFLTPIAQGEAPAPVEASEAQPDGTRARTVQQPRLVQLHRMFADTIRAGQWAAGGAVVLDALTDVLTSSWGRRAFITAADSGVLAGLEKTDLERATEAASDAQVTGCAWHGLGHIRERRGPVSQSGPAFKRALDRLDPGSSPYEVAEARIGLARIVSQNDKSGERDLKEAQARLQTVGALLADIPGADARQLAEQGNALYWLIERKLAGREKIPARRLERLAEVGERLWESYERRLRIIRGDGANVDREAPRLEDGVGPERAYYNLAGFYLGLAKARFDEATASWWVTATQEQQAALLAEVEHDLNEAAQVYDRVGSLRKRRYLGFPHPHHAACVHGLGIIDYHRAALLHRPEHLLDAVSWVQAGLQERWRVAFFDPDLPEEQIIGENDVTKSMELLLKISIAGAMAPKDVIGDQAGSALRVVSQALTELVNWNGCHQSTPKG